ncbi:MAG: glycosyltransferase family 2 protein [Chloroflexi bacterium]|nr:glycosyltransferase family 2 protein [Chloroflexota bacterium]
MSRDLCIVIVSYNTRDLLQACLRSLVASLERTARELDAEVIVVDNASSDGSADMVRTDFPSVRLIPLMENRGFAAANNLALRLSDSRYVLLLNPDTEVLDDAPLALVRFMDAHPDAAVCGCRLLNPDRTFQHSCFRFPTLPMSFLDLFPLHYRLLESRLNGRYPRRWYNHSFPIDHPLGACMMVRRQAIEQVGPLDEGFFMYCEEVDWCYRMKQAGWEIYYTPDAAVIHYGGASTGQIAGPMFVTLHRSRDRFFRKHYGPLYALVARCILILGMAYATWRARRDARAGRIDEETLRQRLATYRAAIS